ncbi:hypothetical protein [Vibrio algarum]|uniref:Sel1 repeat family protein n=1 Tax=Vibrio algarum TaxID=3020714 RepID=A0ABT4YRM2_9VIBR|nr:hypothetical protein [Vibrio sp. KJ40-1]MDB1124052.1 hypothetical protein [Vibrio sp. KJ40-1]
MKSTRSKVLIVTSAFFSHLVLSAPNEKVIAQYNQAAQGDESQVEIVYQQLQSGMKRDGADALSLVYLGSTQTLMGRDAFMPWNKMKYTEQGLATITKGLDLLSTENTPTNEQLRIQGIPESILTRAIAASTFTSLPEMFNHFERGYDLYLNLLRDDTFNSQPYAATSWIYFYAIKAAIKAEDTLQAEQWMQEMIRRNSDDVMTVQAQALFPKTNSSSNKG